MFRKLQKTKFPDSEEKALAYALRILGMRWYGEKELGERLVKKGFNNAVVLATQAKLKEFGYVNDQNRLESLLGEFRDFGTYGRQYIVQKLKQKRYSEEQIKEALEEHWSHEMELVCAKKFLEKLKLPERELEYKERQKILAKFLHRGFSYETSQKALAVDNS